MNEIREGKMYEVLLDAKDRLNGVPIPERIWKKISDRQNIKKEVFQNFKGTTTQHSSWVFILKNLNKIELVDGLIWEMLLSELSEKYDIGVPLIKNLILSLDIEPEKRCIVIQGISSAFHEDTDKVTLEYVMALFYGVDMGWWSEQEVRDIAINSMVPLYDKNSKRNALKKFFRSNPDVLDDLSDNE